MDEKIMVVDENDKFIREEDKVKCHLGNGILHRAFDVIVFNGNKILLTKRSNNKMLWPGFWDGSVASHVRKGETYENAAKRRLKEEIGIDAEPNFLFKFEYKSEYKDVGMEYEICAILKVNYSDQLNIDPKEISEYKFVEIENLKEHIEKNPSIYCPWFIIALDKI